MNIKIVIEYDGGGFRGWQTQPKLRTVQGEITRALSIMAGHEVRIEGSGRTDAGVHAFGQVASFNWTGKIPVEKLRYVLNSRLPEDIYIKALEPVEEDFHARFHALGKSYTYKLFKSDRPKPLRRRYAYRVPESIQVDKMIEGAQHLIGTHNFKSFMASGSHITDTVRTIYKVEIKEVHDEIHLVFYGNGFLYNMVRILAGMLVDIGTGKKLPNDVAKIIAAQDRTLVKRTADAGGLYLTQVYYSENALRESLGEIGKHTSIVIRKKKDE